MNNFFNSDFRNEIEFAFEAINRHWNACVFEEECVFWFIYAINQFQKISEIDYRRAKHEDRIRCNYVFDYFSKHINKFFLTWLKAHSKSGLLTEKHYYFISLLENNIN